VKRRTLLEKAAENLLCTLLHCNIPGLLAIAQKKVHFCNCCRNNVLWTSICLASSATRKS